MWLKWWSLTRSGNVDVFVITFVTVMPHLGRFHHVNSCICVSVVNLLTHWGWVTNICVGNLTIIGSDNGLSPGRRQAIIWTNDGILLIGPLRTNFSEILIGIHTFSSRKMHMKMSSAILSQPQCVKPAVDVVCSRNGVTLTACDALVFQTRLTLPTSHSLKMQ